jgi:hypothetical protein
MKEFLFIFGLLFVGCFGYVYCVDPHAFSKVASIAQAQSILPAQLPPPSSGTSVVGGPSLSAAFVNQVLANAGSPAAGQGDTFYAMSVKYNIDDAWAMAFYRHESSYGTQGVASSLSERTE